MEIGNECNSVIKESRLGLVEYIIWKLDTKLVAWVSSDVEIYSDLSSVFSYSSQIIFIP